MKEIDVSIILVNFNTKILTSNAIESIINKTKNINYEIIVIDNNSHDGSVQYLIDKFKNEIKIVKLNENIGFGGANNIGIENAKGEFVFLLNTDTILINNAVSILYSFIKSNKDVAVCGGNLYDINGNPIHSYAKKIPGFKMVILEPFIMAINKRRKIQRIYDFNYRNQNIEVGYITGADMMIRKNVLAEVGGFDPEFFMYFEESELQDRIHKKGFKIYSIPEAKITHLVGMSLSCNTDIEKRRWKTSILIKSTFLYFEKVYGINTVKYVYAFSQFWNLIFSTFKKEYKINFNITKLEYKKWREKYK